jgi:hypothetical protein
MNNIFKIFVLFLLLFGLPYGSYHYLTKGITFRKNVIKDLSEKVLLKDSIKTIDNENLLYKNKCTVVSVNGAAQDVLNVYLQFKEAKGFQLVANNDPMSMKKVFEKPKAKNEEIFKSSYKLIDSTSLANLKNTYKEKSFIIIDSLRNVRYQYGNSKEDKQKLVAHITALLPYFDEKKGR